MSGLFDSRSALSGLLPEENPGSADSALYRALANLTPSPSPFSSLLSGLPTNVPFPGATPLPTSFLGQALDEYRRRQDWNDRFAHWERSESNAETDRIVRARGMVRNVLSQNKWLRDHGAVIVDQGSFTNRTNTRLDADIDLRVQSPLLKIEYAQDVNPQEAWAEGGYGNSGLTYGEIAAQMRYQIVTDLCREFGAAAVEPGTKAVRVKGLDGSRAEVDVVPVFTLHNFWGSSLVTGPLKHEGVSLLTTDWRWINNYPDQHLENGRQKRLRTGHQFKRVVRIVKRLRADMLQRGVIAVKPSSFLIECLVYLAEDLCFLQPDDDRYGRVRRVLVRVSEMLASPTAYLAMEINGVKPLFLGEQPWTLAEASTFIRAAIVHLGNA